MRQRTARVLLMGILALTVLATTMGIWPQVSGQAPAVADIIWPNGAVSDVGSDYLDSALPQ